MSNPTDDYLDSCDMYYQSPYGIAKKYPTLQRCRRKAKYKMNTHYKSQMCQECWDLVKDTETYKGADVEELDTVQKAVVDSNPIN